ncbi:MAG: PilC/PilY family type IV pilus protein, partial [Xenophilus sp.]
RGDRRREAGATPGGPLRRRGSRQGDVVHSKLWHLPGQPSAGYAQNGYAAFRSSQANRAAMLYVGGNDGMLHAFDAASGEEKLAYVPEGLHPSLAELTRPGYVHRYYVDGSPFSADWWNGSAWATALASPLGAGGKGYVVLDVTDPDRFAAANAGSLVLLDTTASGDPDLGHIFSEPVMERSDPTLTRQITRLNNGRWALVTGNGYNSASEKAVLLIQYLDGGRELARITADGTGGNGNGLSAPRLVDLNGDKVPDVAYAGDLLGNLWKFDLSSASAGDWKTAFGNAPLYVAADAAGMRQSITSAPLHVPHPDGGLMVVFGTGRTLSDADRGAAAAQTVYGIHDNTPIAIAAASPSLGAVTLDAGAAGVSGRDALVAQSIAPHPAGTTSDTGTPVHLLSSNPVDYGGSSPRRGWYLDLPAPRERVTDNPTWFDGDLIDIHSLVPAIGPADQAYLTTLNAVNGQAPTSQIYAYAPGEGGAVNGARVQTGLGIGLRGSATERRLGAPGSLPLPERRLLGKVTLRPSWRQLQ